MKKILEKLKWFILHIEEIIAVIALAVMLCAIFYNVIMRYLFRNPTAWSDELTMICLAYVTFVGGASAYKKNLHFGIDILVDRLPIKGKLFLWRVINFVFIFLFGYTTFLGYQLTIKAVKKFHYSGWSYKIMDAALPLGFLSMTIYAIYFFALSFKNPDKFIMRYESSYEEETVDNELVAASAEIFKRNDDEKGGV